MTGPGDDFIIREEIRAVMVRAVRSLDGEVTERVVYGGSGETDFPVRVPGPALTAITTARKLEAAARHELVSHVKYARQDGATWGDIGEAIGFKPHPETPRVAESAFRVVAPGTSEYNDTFAWVCPSCRQVVIDHGPFEANPADTERNHAEGCARLTAAVAEYERQQGDT